MIVTFQPGPDRWRLGFKPAVLAAFGFLEEMGFRVVRAEDTFVRYESSTVFLNVYHGRGSYGLGVELGWLADQRPFELGLASALATGRPELEVMGGGTAFARPLVEKLVREMALNTRKYSLPLLTGNASAFAALGVYQDRVSEEFVAAQRLRDIRATAERARIAHDWAGVARAYAAIASDLTPLEQRRLHFARKMLGQPSAGHE